MAIYIPPIILVIMAVILCNCIISFSKNKILSKCYLLLSTIFSFVGIIGIIVVRPRFHYFLNKRENLRIYEPDFITWAVVKFDTFVVPSIVINCSIILCLLLYLLLNKRKSGFIWINTTPIVISIMMLNFITGVWYGIGTINKFFDIANFISQILVAEFFALHIPLIVKRIIIGKNKIGSVEGEV